MLESLNHLLKSFVGLRSAALQHLLERAEHSRACSSLQNFSSYWPLTSCCNFNRLNNLLLWLCWLLRGLYTWGDDPCLLLPPLRVKLRGSRGGVDVAGLLRGDPLQLPLPDTVPCCGDVDELLGPRVRPSNCACPAVRDLSGERIKIDVSSLIGRFGLVSSHLHKAREPLYEVGVSNTGPHTHNFIWNFNHSCQVYG
jgi:hypothetical protein